MKKYLIVVFVIYSHFVSYSQSENQKTEQFSLKKYFTTKDSVLLASFEEDRVYVSKDEFNDVVSKHPEFFEEYPNDPNVTYVKSIDEQFSSEVGQDDYYLFYAYFLRNTNEMYDHEDYSNQRNKIMIIYTRLNKIFSIIDGGGLGYMHLYRRIFGEAEYTVYLYALTRSEAKITYDISKQKKLFKQTLRQVVTDRLENTFDIKEIDKLDKKKEIYTLINEIDSQITDFFYLTQAQKFYYNNYSTW